MPALIGGREGAMDRRLSFRELRKNASFYLRDKLRQARLALTDVTPAQLLVEEATSGGPYGPDAKTLKNISRAGFEVDDYWRIVDVLRKRLEKLDGDRWREWYQALTVLEHLVVHGPDSASREFQPDSDAIRSQAATFRYIDERSFNWGLAVQKRSEKVVKLLERGPLLHEERERARALYRGIQGFGGATDDFACLEEITSSSGAGECRRASLFEGEDEKNTHEGAALVPAGHGGAWIFSQLAAEETESQKELEWSKEMMILRGGNGNRAVTAIATCAGAASAIADESKPLLAVGE